MGKGAKRDPQFAQMIEAACKYDKPIRIGVNWGSLDQELLASIMDSNAALAVPKTAQEVMIEALIQSALQSAEKAVEFGMNPDQILLSCKVSNVQDLVAVYRDLSHFFTILPRTVSPSNAMPSSTRSGRTLQGSGSPFTRIIPG